MPKTAHRGTLRDEHQLSLPTLNLLPLDEHKKPTGKRTLVTESIEASFMVQRVRQTRWIRYKWRKTHSIYTKNQVKIQMTVADITTNGYFIKKSW